MQGIEKQWTSLFSSFSGFQDAKEIELVNAVANDSE